MSELAIHAQGLGKAYWMTGRKDEAIRVRQLLVRRGLHCTFPAPLWKKSRHVFHAVLDEATPLSELERIVSALEGVELQRDRA